MSYANLMLYCATLPSYEGKEKDEKEKNDDNEVIKADDPKNREKTRQILFGE